ncbi:MAG: AraC family transcriptional regulator [Phycisphaerales bacterium]
MSESADRGRAESILSSVRVGGAGGGAARDAGFEIRDLVYRGRAEYPRHEHDYASLFVILSGRVREQSRRTPVDCGAGAVGYIPAGAAHRSSFGEAPSHGLTVVLRDDWLRRLSRPGGGLGAMDEPGYAQNPLVSAAAFRLHAACRRQDSLRTIATEEVVLELLAWATGGSPGADAPPARPPEWLGTVTDLVRDAAAAPLVLADVSDAAGRHPAHVCRAFRAAMGCSLTEYAQMIRVQQACALMRAGDRPLAVIALETGFYDQAHFSRVFRRHVGVTPRAYRASFR